MVLGHGLGEGLRIVQAALLPAFLLALAVSGILVTAGWRRRRDILVRQSQRSPSSRFELGQTPFTSGLLDVATEVGAVLAQCESLAAERLVDLELAVQPGLAVRTDARVLREILNDLVVHAVEQSPCGRVLLGAAQVGNRVQVTVSDAGSGADRAAQASWLRPAERLAALQGATLDVDARIGEGTTVVLRLPTSGTVRRAATKAPAAGPASVWTSPQDSRETSGAAR
jgi:hypothetical protein